MITDDQKNQTAFLHQGFNDATIALLECVREDGVEVVVLCQYDSTSNVFTPLAELVNHQTIYIPPDGMEQEKKPQ